MVGRHYARYYRRRSAIVFTGRFTISGAYLNTGAFDYQFGALDNGTDELAAAYNNLLYELPSGLFVSLSVLAVRTPLPIPPMGLYCSRAF